MTTTTKLERAAWKPYFDNVSRLMEGRYVEMEIAALNIGSQIATEWVPLFGVTYDAHEDILAIMAEGLDHMIRKPRDVFIEAEGVELLSMEVIDTDGMSHIVRFREPLLLSAP